MQTIAAHTPPHAQHVPPGWSFPTLTPAVPPQPGATAPGTSAPVTGGGDAMTVTRMRWGRLLPVLAGLALLAFGIWTATSEPGGATTAARDVAGTDTSTELDVAAAAGAGETADDAATSAATPAAPPAAATPARPRAGAATPARGTGASNRPNRTRRAGAAAGGSNAFAAASAGAAGTGAGAPGTRAGAQDGELPMTGLETWIAAALGILLLAGGIIVHVNAVRLGMTAMLYRRGILLRPTECARLVADGETAARLRVLLSDLLHRLLEEPTPRGSEFVSARHAH